MLVLYKMFFFQRLDKLGIPFFIKQAVKPLALAGGYKAIGASR